MPEVPNLKNYIQRYAKSDDDGDSEPQTAYGRLMLQFAKGDAPGAPERGTITDPNNTYAFAWEADNGFYRAKRAGIYSFRIRNVWLDLSRLTPESRPWLQIMYSSGDLLDYRPRFTSSEISANGGDYTGIADYEKTRSIKDQEVLSFDFFSFMFDGDYASLEVEVFPLLMAPAAGESDS